MAAEKKVIVKATFKGLNGSCGYETNKEYDLQVRHSINRYVQIEKLGGATGYCDYGSMVSFMENWDNVRRI